MARSAAWATNIQMDLIRTISDLRAQLDQINRVIASLEELARSVQTPGQTPAAMRSRRGRKSMGAEERREVSERMRRYWAKRRKDGLRREGSRTGS